MKKSDLQKSIREMIVAELSESTIDVPNPKNLTPSQKQKFIQQARISQQSPSIGTSNDPVDFVEEIAKDETSNPVTKQLADIRKQIERLRKQEEELNSSLNLKENSLNEAPVYDVVDMEGFNKAYDEFKENPPIKSKSLDLLLNKLKSDGTVDTSALSKEKGVDSAIFNNQAIRKYISDPGGEFTDYLTKKDKRTTSGAPVPKKEPSEKVAKMKSISEPKGTKLSSDEKEAYQRVMSKVDQIKNGTATRRDKQILVQLYGDPYVKGILKKTNTDLIDIIKDLKSSLN
jgi:hypothetical protein